MLDTTGTPPQILPNAPGVGYKPQHFAEIMEDPTPVEWLDQKQKLRRFGPLIS